MRDVSCRGRIPLLLAVLVALPSVRAATPVPLHSQWRFHRGLTEASQPITAWRERTFNDSAWETGPATFVYGEPGFTGTDLSDMANTYTTLYLRKTFVVPAPANVASLELTAVCDDGFAAWINGR